MQLIKKNLLELELHIGYCPYVCYGRYPILSFWNKILLIFDTGCIDITVFKTNKPSPPPKLQTSYWSIMHFLKPGYIYFPTNKNHATASEKYKTCVLSTAFHNLFDNKCTFSLCYWSDLKHSGHVFKKQLIVELLTPSW